MKILIVDDDPAMRDLYRSLLEEAKGHEIFEATDGMAGYEALDTGTAPDLCVVDMRMPRMSGREFVARLRSEERFKQQKVMICSGVNERLPIVEIASLGIDAYLLKPFPGETFLERVRQLGEKPPATHAEPLAPLNDLLARLETSRETYLELLRAFTGQVSEAIALLLSPRTSESAREIPVRLAAIRTTARSLGADPLGARAASLERLLANPDPAGQFPAIAALEVEHKRLLAALAKLTGQTDPPSNAQVANEPAPSAEPSAGPEMGAN